MTPAQLRAYSAVVRLGSGRAAAEELGVSDAGVSMHVTQLRKELDDQLFSRTSSGLAFTPGGLRLASRAIEILVLQRQTAIEVTEAPRGRRLLRIAASSSLAGRLIQVKAPGLAVSGQWCASTLPPPARQPAASEPMRFITTPRCTQAMIRGTGVGVTRFRPKVHVTLWSWQRGSLPARGSGWPHRTVPCGVCRRRRTSGWR